ncbi:MAG TPA: relaxase [Allosphingosinicella sp.]|nr:relaxase [Allosphingosinicella sp.]
MILKGSQRAGASELAAHLLNERDNEHICVHELRGFAADDLHGALTEAQAVSKGTKCKQYMFSLSLNPPKGAVVGEAEFVRAADRAERTLGLEGQARAVVFHEKEGRRHAHAVWSRIDAATMRAVNLPHFKRKLASLSRELFLEHDWTLPDGLRVGGGKSPLNFTLAEWQQAKRLGRDPREIKTVFQEAWARSDSLKALGNALAERGYFLARGDRRGLVAVDVEGEVYALAKWCGVKVREARAKLGEAALPSMDAVRAEVAGLATDKLKSFAAEVRLKHKNQLAPLRENVDEMSRTHAGERARLARKQAERWAEETQERGDRMRAGLRGLWDNITGRARSIRALNEEEAVRGMMRDRAQRDRLIWAQLKERQPLQARLDALRARHVDERRLLAQEIVRHLRSRALGIEARPFAPVRSRKRDGPSLER